MPTKFQKGVLMYYFYSEACSSLRTNPIIVYVCLCVHSSICMDVFVWMYVSYFIFTVRRHKSLCNTFELLCCIYIYTVPERYLVIMQCHAAAVRAPPPEYLCYTKTVPEKVSYCNIFTVRRRSSAGATHIIRVCMYICQCKIVPHTSSVYVCIYVSTKL